MIVFNKVLWKQILTLCRLLQASSSLDLKTVGRWHRAESINFKETFEFLVDLEIVKVINNKIILSTALRKVIESDDESIRRFFVNKIFQKKSNLVKYFEEFLNNFELYEDSYKYKANLQERLKYSDIRNFLISLDVLTFEPGFGGYKLKRELSTYPMDQDKILSYNEFVKKIRAKEALGREAELLIFKWEKEKFKKTPLFQEKICHVSLKNVRAGYDIRSFKRKGNKKWIQKYIEVKAVSENDWSFYWSKNEINKSKQLSESYYLYLLPVKNSAFDISGLRQIKNPYYKVFQNQNEWLREIETMSFYKK